MLKSKKNIAIIIAFVAFLFLLDFIFNHLSYSFTNSVGYNLFYVTKRFQEIKKGDYVMFVMPSANIKILKEEIKKFKTNIAVKQVACMPGDRITVKNRMFYCNGYYLGTAKTKAKTGEPLAYFNFNGTIPDGYFFAFGSNPDSYDSRYFGLVPFKSVLMKAYPIL